MSDKKSLIVMDEPATDIVTADGIRAAMTVESAKRQAITEYIRENLKEGVDYGRIGNFPKPVLLKPGAEKFCSLMHFRPVFRKDDATLSMLPQSTIDNAGGIIALVCELHSDRGVVSEGRGACSLAEKKGQLNVAIKIAQKRALIDACLRAFSISDAFTQDIDDPESPITGEPDSTIDRPKDVKVERLAINDRVKAAMKLLGWSKTDLDAAIASSGKSRWEELDNGNALKWCIEIERQTKEIAQ